MSKINKGKQVEFSIGKNAVVGTVENIIEKNTIIDNKIIHASESNPKLDILYEKTGTHFIRTFDNVNTNENENEKHIDIRKGDSVDILVGPNELHGKITKVITDKEIVNINGHGLKEKNVTVYGSEENPHYVVHYDKTNTDFIRTEESINH